MRGNFLKMEENKKENISKPSVAWEMARWCHLQPSNISATNISNISATNIYNISATNISTISATNISNIAATNIANISATNISQS